MHNALRRSTGILLGALLLAFAATSASGQTQGDAPVEPGQTFTGRALEVTDGDTFGVRRSIGGTVTIRLHGVDAPESAQPHGRAATRAAQRYVDGKNVRVSVEEIGHYGRAVVRLEVK
ncbi:thermonuclease family protein [Salinibacter ruber]|uniref:thermonuclease family protein n=1 Tax=Salinibacter ruber TaxID=146919 RepID=UPI002168AD58|nr:thermonuclease family protein [Salinibacter ruber]MCS3698368.1 endonuclease YncB(thermonuclease family) [Salinibacter ruber]